MQAPKIAEKDPAPQRVQDEPKEPTGMPKKLLDVVKATPTCTSETASPKALPGYTPPRSTVNFEERESTATEH